MVVQKVNRPKVFWLTHRAMSRFDLPNKIIIILLVTALISSLLILINLTVFALSLFSGMSKGAIPCW
jgi:hypothetical protein